jgi:hypothetical protein
VSARQSAALSLLVLAALSVLAYLPTLRIPLIEDDYPNLWESQTYGPLAAAPSLMQNSVFRLRATSSWTMWQMWQAFHLDAAAYHAFSLSLHIVNVWLLFGLALALAGRALGRAAPTRAVQLAFFAAAFFAVAEGHQEAVMWFSAINELWMFCFGMASMLCWVLATRPGGRLAWLPVSWLLFALALVSKETAVVFLPLFLMAGWAAEAPWKRALAGFAPHVALACVALASIAQSSGQSFRFTDGSFSLHAPFWLVWPRGMARLLGVCGGLALAAVLWLREKSARRAAYFALAWAGMALAPYSFLTYSLQIPSRQTYLASAGVAMLVGLALYRFLNRGARSTAVVWAVAAIVLLANADYIWTRKRAQFVARAAPTEALIGVARRTHGPIWVRCFPRVPYIAEEAVELGAGMSPSSLEWSEAEAAKRPPAAVFCFEEPTAASRR